MIIIFMGCVYQSVATYEVHSIERVGNKQNVEVRLVLLPAV
jgi:hypothetical protein